MAITVKHNKVSTIPDTDDTSLVRPSDWNADHTLVGTIDVANGGTGANTLTGYVKGNGTSAMTAVATVPSTDITGLGTMSTQNATAVAITGGTINGTTIGATTPSTVNATTITGQTGVLRGTGQNLSLQSEQVNLWGTPTAATVVTDATTSPTGTSNADKLQENTANSNHFLSSTNQSLNYVLGITYTRSCYIKQDGRKYVSIFFPSTNFPSTGRTAIFDVNAGTVYLAEAGVTAIITSVGNGWFRCSIAVTCTVAGSGHTGGSALYDNSGNSVYLGDGTSGAFLWGAQVELGSTANTYIPTTTTAIYGTPTLSFSGVSSIGLLSTGALYLQPAGTGALQAQATTSTTAGGNARGANAVDWSTIRSTDATRVASGTYSVLSGGSNNRATGYSSTLGGGEGCSATSNYVVVGGGSANTASGNFATNAGGRLNTASGYFGFVGGGATNSTTSNSAVTTQSGTMNGTTAVTLSGSNANIKVGQYITGTSIATDTYVAAISGTALTLSKVASGSSTSTLSFFTPHGVVVGGGNNQATGSYSFIGGGGDAGTAANRNVASGDYSFVGGGTRNTASGIGSFVGGGGTNGSSTFPSTASGTGASIVGGFNNTSSGFGSFVGGGYNNTANSQYSAITGGDAGTTRSILGNHVFPACVEPISTALGVSQAALLILGVQTTDATATALRSGTAAAGTTNQVILPNNSAYLFKATVISNVTGGGNTSAWKLEGAIKRGANAASTTIVGLVTTTLLAQDAGAATWAIAATADTTNGGLRITFTGQASTTIRTVCKVETTEVTF